jgi:hypothetical protein
VRLHQLRGTGARYDSRGSAVQDVQVIEGSRSRGILPLLFEVRWRCPYDQIFLIAAASLAIAAPSLRSRRHGMFDRGAKLPIGKRIQQRAARA